MLLVYHFVSFFFFRLIKLQTLSGDDASGVDVLGKQISDFDSHTKTWGRREVNFTLISSVNCAGESAVELN